MKHSKTYLLIPLAAILCMGCGNQDSSTAGSISATTMRLERSQGAVQVQDDAGEGVDLQEKLPLYSGYALDTPSDSYAWVNLDDTKLTVDSWPRWIRKAALPFIRKISIWS